MPNIQIKRDGCDPYVYCPLRVRMDQDRVHRQIHACGRFESVQPIGSGSGPFKEYPWKHMAPYKTGFLWQRLVQGVSMKAHDSEKLVEQTDISEHTGVPVCMHDEEIRGRDGWDKANKMASRKSPAAAEP